MPTATVNISFDKRLLNQIDRVARNEFRSRSELIREASRMYIERQKRWDELMRMADKHMKGKRIGDKKIADEIHALRRSRRSK
ncbi:ribbon-helix-helix protein, CopG family [bacterium]|nr:ribbon-helix-helix protein, CopG family [bacterium]